MKTILRATALLTVAWVLTGVLTVQALMAQNYVRQDPDCQVYFSFTSATSTTSFDNRSNGCTEWVIAYYNYAYVGLTLTTQSAADAAGAPGAWGAFAGTVVTGVNPNTALTSAFSVMSGNYPWLRVTLSGLAGGPGTVRGVLYGWKFRPSSASTSTVDLTKVGGAAITLGQKAMAASFPVTLASDQSVIATTTNLVQVGSANVSQGQKAMASSVPVVISSDQSALPANIASYGGTATTVGQKAMAASMPVVLASDQASIPVAATSDVTKVGGTGLSLGQKPMATSIPVTMATDQTQCPSRAVITVAAAGTIEIVPLSGASQIVVCHVSLSFSGATGVQFIEGTGAACVTGPANVTGDYKNVAALALGFPGAPLLGTGAKALCMTTSGAVTGGGLVTYGYK